jgi:hypothetical protein
MNRRWQSSAGDEGPPSMQQLEALSAVPVRELIARSNNVSFWVAAKVYISICFIPSILI